MYEFNDEMMIYEFNDEMISMSSMMVLMIYEFNDMMFYEYNDGT